MLRSKVTFLFMTCAVILLVFPAMASAQVAPTIQSHKADYAPGELVTLTGGGWQPGESVHINVNDTYGATWSRNVDVIADANGNITDSFNLPDAFVSDYDVTATGAQSGTATTTFTDNKPNTVAVTPAIRTVAQGTNSTTYTVTVGLNGNNTDACTVTLNAQGLPPNTTHSFSGNPRNVSATTPSFTSTLTVNVTNQTPGKTFPFTVHATSQAATCQNAQDITSNSVDLVVTDNTAPNVAITSPSGSTTTDSSINVSGTASDASGIQGVTVNGNAATFTYNSGSSTDGTWTRNNVSLSCGDNTITAVATDDSDAHNTKSTSITVTRSCDTTPPVITKTITGTEGTNGWYTSNVTVQWTVNDPEGGVVIDSGCGTQNFTSSTASVTSSCSAHSAGGSASDSVTLKIDKEAPNVSVAASRDPNSNGWYNHAVEFSATGSNYGPSGAGSCDANESYSGPDDENASVSMSCTDGAGNSGSATFNFKYDATAPTISGSASPTPTSFGWNNGTVTVSYTCDDNLSGVDGTCGPNETLPNEGAGQSSTGSVTDAAGNPANTTVSGINIDLTNPLVSLNGGPANDSSHYFGFVPNAPTCTASDALSGLDGACSVSGYSNAVGSHTVKAEAKDKAANTNSVSNSYTVLGWDFRGFYQPVDMGTTVNTVKGGSTVPFKFELFAGSNELTETSRVNQPLKATKVNCDSGATEDTIELTATGGTQLRYDTTGGQYIYNWQTPKQAGACYDVTITANDGSSKTAHFKLK
jgi:hypothetical protein